MNTNLNIDIDTQFRSNSQKIRVLSEFWMENNMYCPICISDKINCYPNNRPVADFFCGECASDFELKSKKGHFGAKVVDGAYNAMISRITSENNPNFFFLEYSPELVIDNLFIVPKHLFHPGIIQKRNPLSPTARRAGWVGCNILIAQIPALGKISIVADREIVEKKIVRQKLHKSDFLIGKDTLTKGWILDIIRCIERIPTTTFSLSEVYSFKSELKLKHPNNNFISDKIRQQLQYLRNLGFIEFVGKGVYKKLKIN